MADYELMDCPEWSQSSHAQRIEEGHDSDWTVVQNKKERSARSDAMQPQQRRQRPSSQAPISQAPRNSRSEIAPPRRWQATHSQHLLRRPTRRNPERMGSDSGNTGEAEWRTGRVGPIDSVKIPEGLCLKDKYYDQIAREHDTFVFSDHKHATGGTRTFGIWGDRNQAAKTRRLIAEWIEAVCGPDWTKSAANFARIVSLTPALREKEEKKWIRAVTKQRFRQHPPPDAVFQSIGNFHWPSDEYTPEEILGPSYEALDPIRMDCKCYVVYRSEHKTFRIMGETKAVHKGMDRMRKCFYQIASRQVTGPRKYLLRWPEPSQMPAKVTMDAYQYPLAKSSKAPEARTGKTARGADYEEDEDFTFQSAIQTDINYAKARTCILKTLPKLHYYRGNLQFRIRLGTFLVDQFRITHDGSYNLTEYEDMIRESQFVGHVTQEVGDKHAESLLLEKFQQAQSLIIPLDNMVDDLKAVQPIFAVTFTFADRKGDLRLVQEWQLGYDSDDFDLCLQKWSRLDLETGSPRTLLDVSLLNLIDGQTWQIDITAADPLDDTRLPKTLSKFAASVKIVPATAKAQAVDRPFVTYNPYTSLKSFQQRISYRYRINGTHYTLDLFRFQDTIFPRYSATKAATPTMYEARWSINVFGGEWDIMFAQNESLGVGEGSTWKDDVATWFPKDFGPGSGSPDNCEYGGEGWDQLLQKLEMVETIVKAGKASLGEHLIGGMDVV